MDCLDAQEGRHDTIDLIVIDILLKFEVIFEEREKCNLQPLESL